MGADQKALSAQQREALMQELEARFKSNGARHAGIAWEQVRERLERDPQKLWSLNEMERTGGEPDVVGVEPESGACVFYDCAEQSPVGRRNLCYDDEALEARKKDKPRGSAMGMAAHMGAELLDEAQYRALQQLGAFDTKTSSWVAAPPDVRRLGGALFGDRRYERVFIYHNGAQSYYSSRGFRACLGYDIHSEENMEYQLLGPQNDIAYVRGGGVLLTDINSALDLMATVSYETGCRKIILDKERVAEGFFILSTGIAGEILQKFVNYKTKLAVVGDYARYTSKPLQDFIYESNNGRDIFFVQTLSEALEKLSGVE